MERQHPELQWWTGGPAADRSHVECTVRLLVPPPPEDTAEQSTLGGAVEYRIHWNRTSIYVAPSLGLHKAGVFTQYAQTETALFWKCSSWCVCVCYFVVVFLIHSLAGLTSRLASRFTYFLLSWRTRILQKLRWGNCLWTFTGTLLPINVFSRLFLASFSTFFLLSGSKLAVPQQVVQRGLHFFGGGPVSSC